MRLKINASTTAFSSVDKFDLSLPAQAGSVQTAVTTATRIETISRRATEISLFERVLLSKKLADI
jgi:hypothetical protein